MITFLKERKTSLSRLTSIASRTTARQTSSDLFKRQRLTSSSLPALIKDRKPRSPTELLLSFRLQKFVTSFSAEFGFEGSKEFAPRLRLHDLIVVLSSFSSFYQKGRSFPGNINETIRSLLFFRSIDPSLMHRLQFQILMTMGTHQHPVL